VRRAKRRLVRLARTPVRAAWRFVTTRRHRLPRRVDRWLDVFRWTVVERIRRPAATEGLEPAPAPAAAPRRVLIAAANFAGQGWAWARALERHAPGPVAAQSWYHRSEASFDYPADYAVPMSVYRQPLAWQRAQFDAVVDRFDAVVIEAGRPLFGRLY